ncbi:hypothetical protein [Tahibacter soli]|uniref:Uncharacterized protein n=1 Tax=Tahibacter soli TaxID=2983605 RepID=A0A9X3YI80_9GAMM|nr:hypothetical protein [Tahibacter soli]MDC8012786.1 hypothetical protein [Tahibacter soli]
MKKLAKFHPLGKMAYRDPASALQVMEQALREGGVVHKRDRTAWEEAQIGFAFALGLSSRYGQQFGWAAEELSDFDGVLCWSAEPKVTALGPVQIKTVKREGLPGRKSLQEILDGLEDKYTGSSNLTVLIYLEAGQSFDFFETKVPKANNLAGIYVLSHGSGDNEMTLDGDLLDPQAGGTTDFRLDLDAQS